MGADLYLNSVFQKHGDKYAPKFDHWVAKRNALHKAGQQEAADRAQKWVLKYYDKMHERGYFRDSYNPSNLLRLFDLSWWQDVLEGLVGKDGKMSPRNAERFLRMLADRGPVFEAKLKKVEPAKGETRAEVEKYFRDKYERLKAFLRQAIDRKDCIELVLRVGLETAIAATARIPANR
jgi:hypothetical protein